MRVAEPGCAHVAFERGLVVDRRAAPGCLHHGKAAHCIGVAIVGCGGEQRDGCFERAFRLAGVNHHAEPPARIVAPPGCGDAVIVGGKCRVSPRTPAPVVEEAEPFMRERVARFGAFLRERKGALVLALVGELLDRVAARLVLCESGAGG